MLDLVKTVAACQIEFLRYKSATQEKLNSSNADRFKKTLQNPALINK